MGFKQKIFSSLVWGNLLAMLLVIIAIIIGAWYFLAVYTHHGESIRVPNVVGHQINDAHYQLESLGLKGVVVDSAYNKQKPAGCVLEQTPPMGRKVKGGREIYLTINTEQMPTMVLPDIADNSSLREAEAKLKAMGFKLGPVEYVAGDLNWVYGVKSRGHNVYAGERVPIDIPLILQVGKDANGGEDFDEYDDTEDFGDDSEGGLDDPNKISESYDW